jgi:hypothetical protein
VGARGGIEGTRGEFRQAVSAIDIGNSSGATAPFEGLESIADFGKYSSKIASPSV